MPAIEAARAVLPLWVVWAPLLLIGLAFLLSLVASWAGARIALRRFLREQPPSWVERARLAYPARDVIGTNVILFPAVFAGIAYCSPGPLCPVRRQLVVALAALA